GRTATEAALFSAVIPSYSSDETWQISPSAAWRCWEEMMAARELTANEVGLPQFIFAQTSHVEVFDLDSHARAREALDFGLNVSGVGFNIFVVGEDRAGRMTAT